MSSVDDYLGLVTSEHKLCEKYMSFLSSNLEGIVATQNVVASFPEKFDVDNAEGVQLDTIGKWAGVSRYLSRAIETDDGPISVLPDETFSFLVKAQIVANSWDGSIPGAYDAWQIAFGRSAQLRIQDNQNMSMSVLLIVDGLPNLTRDLISQGFLPMKPDGVLANYFISPAGGPIFSWDKEETEFFAGWDIGSWAESF